MHDDGQNVIGGAEARELHANQRTAREIKRLLRFGVEPRLRALLAFVRRRRFKIRYFNFTRSTKDE